MARGDFVDAGKSKLSNRDAYSGFWWRYANTSQEAINTNSDIIEIFPYIWKSNSVTDAYTNNLYNSYIQVSFSSTSYSQTLRTKYNFGNVSLNTNYALTGEFNSSNPFGYSASSSTTYITTATKDGKTIYGARFTIPHNQDGTSPTVTMKWHLEASPTHGNAEKTISITLDTIPRASKPTCSNTTLGVSTRINTNRVSNSFTHTLNIKIGSTTIETFSNIGEYKDWTPTLANYLSYIPSTSGTATIECITYSNGSEIGRATTSCVLTVPNNSDTKPTLTLTISKGDNVVPDAWGVYVKGKSKLAISIVGSPKAGTSITSYYSTANGSSDTRSSYTTSELTGSGSVVANVKDGRGFTSNNATASYTVQDYTNPQIYSETTIARCDSNGNITDDGTYALFTFKGKIESINNNNSKYFSLSYKEKSAGNYTFIKGWETFELSTQAVNEIAKINNVPIVLDITKEYVFRFEASDYFNSGNNSIYRDIEIGTVADLMNFNSSGKSMAFGGVSQRGTNENVIDFNINVEFHKPILNEVVVDSIRSKNMFDINNLVYGAYISASGQITANESFAYTGLIPVKNKTYTISGDFKINSGAWNFRIHGYNSSGAWVRQVYVKEINSNITSFSFTNDDTSVKYLRLSMTNETSANNLNILQLEEGSATTYSPYQNLDAKEIVLWRNPDTSTSFSSQNINLSTKDYTYYEVICIDQAGFTRCSSTGKIPKGYSCTLLTNRLSSNSAIQVWKRYITYSNENTLVAEVGQIQLTNSTSSSDNNGVMIPFMIIGYK